MVFVNVWMKCWFLGKTKEFEKKNVFNISNFLICMHGNKE